MYDLREVSRVEIYRSPVYTQLLIAPKNAAEQTMKEEQSINLVFFTSRNLQETEIARQILQLLFRYGAKFAPEKFDNGKRWIPFEATSVESLISHWARSHNCLMRRNREFKSELAVSMQYMSSGFNSISLWVEQSYFYAPLSVEDFLRMSIALYDLISPIYGSIHQTGDAIKMATVQDKKYGQTIVPINLTKGLPNIYWANFLGPKYVELMGKSKAFLSPCKDLKELKDGGILLITTTSPLDVDHKQQEELRNHIGEAFFYRWPAKASHVPEFG